MASTDKNPPGIWKGQLLHIICLLLLLSLIWLVWNHLGNPFPVLFWSAILIPIVHQIFVWLTWRLELQYAITSKSLGFQTYFVIFFILLIGRVISVFALALVDRGSLILSVTPRFIITSVLIFISGYIAYSLKKYFGFIRAAGADHFDPEYRSMPLVKEGIFRYTNNGMYVFGFAILWAIAIGFSSTAALIAAFFNHVYIWVHFYATEKPDMDYLYGSP